MGTEYQLRINGAMLLLREHESSAEELSSLLTARFGASEAGASKAVALEDATTSVIFPLNVVAARPDLPALSEKLLVLFSWTSLTILLKSLCDNGLLSEQEVRTLIPLSEDPFVTAAFEVYRAEGDESDLVDTLQRIVAIRLGGAHVSSKSNSQQPSSVAMDHQVNQNKVFPNLSGNELLEQLTAALRLQEFPAQEVKVLSEAFVGNGKLNSDEHAVLIQLINKQLPHLQAAYEIYLEESDQTALLSSLKRVARHFGMERVVRGLEHSRALLDAFASGNPMVCGAWDVYVDEHNEDDFRDTLTRCVPRLIPTKSTITSSTKPSDEKSALRRFVIWLHSEGKITTEQGQRLMSIVDSGSAEAERAMTAYLKSDRSETAGGNLMNAVFSLIDDGIPLTSSAQGEDEFEDRYDEAGDGEMDDELRDHIVSFLDDLAESQGLLSKACCEKLKALVDSRDQRLLAAFDLFNEENDLDDLVDTLQRLAEKVVLVTAEDDNGNDGDEEFFDDEEDLTFHSLFEVISDMGLTMPQLELIRDAMEIHDPDMEDIIDRFSEAGNDESFREDLVEFCQRLA